MYSIITVASVWNTGETGAWYGIESPQTGPWSKLKIGITSIRMDSKHSPQRKSAYETILLKYLYSVIQTLIEQ